MGGWADEANCLLQYIIRTLAPWLLLGWQSVWCPAHSEDVRLFVLNTNQEHWPAIWWKKAAAASAPVCVCSWGGLCMSHSTPVSPANQITRRPRPPRTGRTVWWCSRMELLCKPQTHCVRQNRWKGATGILKIYIKQHKQRLRSNHISF